MAADVAHGRGHLPGPSPLPKRPFPTEAIRGLRGRRPEASPRSTLPARAKQRLSGLCPDPGRCGLPGGLLAAFTPQPSAARTQLKTRAQRAPPAAGVKETLARKWKRALLETKCPRGCFSGGRALGSKTGRVGSVTVRVRVSSSGRLSDFCGANCFTKREGRTAKSKGAGDASSRRPMEGHGPQHGNLVLFFRQVSVPGEPPPVKRRGGASPTPKPLERSRAGRGSGEGTISPSGGAHGGVVTLAPKRAL